MKPVFWNKKGEMTTLILLLGLTVVAIVTVLTPPTKKTITNTKAAGSCAEIVSVAYSPSPIASGGTMNTTVVVSSAYAGSGNIAVGWMKNGAWPQNGGLWQGATCNGMNCTFTIRMDQYTVGTTDKYELAGYDMTAACGPNTGKKIPIVLQSNQTPTNTPVPPTPTRGYIPTSLPTNAPVAPTSTPLPTNTPRPGVPTPTQGNFPTSAPTNTPILPTATPTTIPTATPTKGPDCAQIVSVTFSPSKVASGTNFGCTVTVDNAHSDNPNIYCTLLKNGITNLSSAISFRGRCYGTTCNSTLKMDNYSAQTSERYELVGYDGTVGCGLLDKGKRTTMSIYTSVPSNTPSPTPIPPTATPTSRPTLTPTPNPSATYYPLTNTPVPPTATPTRGFIPTGIPPTATPKPPTATPTPTKLPDCISLEIHGRNEDKHDVIFIPYNFTDSEFEEFKGLAQRAIQISYQTGLGSLLNKLNFYAYTRTENQMDISMEDVLLNGQVVGQRISIKDSGKAAEIGIKCNGDTVLIIVKSDKWGGTAYMGMNMALVTSLGVDTAIHELGHSIASLDDEYNMQIEAQDTDIPHTNCTKTPSSNESEACPGWEKFSDATCYKGCYFNNWYRSTDQSTMNAWDITVPTKKFNKVSIKAWEEALQNYK